VKISGICTELFSGRVCNVLKHKSLKRYFYLVFGFICTAFGILGIFVPLLPTTPLLLAAMFFFSRSSERFNQMLVQNRFLKQYIEPYIRNQPVPRATKIRTIVLLWTALTISGFFVYEKLWLLFILLLVGIGVTLHVVKLK
jgi:hypothetical protein